MFPALWFHIHPEEAMERSSDKIKWQYGIVLRSIKMLTLQQCSGKRN
jgi:hypothetical protein